MRSLLLASLATVASAGRYVLYFDQYHTKGLPDHSVTAGVTHAITAFANSSIFTTGTAYTPFMSVAQVRALFDANTKVCMAIGGWGDTAGYGVGSATDASRKAYAKNVATTVNNLGYDCVDVDWEYPGGNGEDYKVNPNSGKVAEIQNFPLLLAEIKTAIGSKSLSIAAPGLERDMLAYTKDTIPKINAAVDMVNVMSYDLINRRDTATGHHTSLKGSLDTVVTYIGNGFNVTKMNLGIALYAKWFTTADGADCSGGAIGCPLAVLENPSDGSDTGKSGSMTFEADNFAPVPASLSQSSDGSCGAGTTYTCGSASCCGQYGFCGAGDNFCQAGCQAGYGLCKGPDLKASFKNALAQGQEDTDNGGQWWWDQSNKIFWSWDTPDIINKKFGQIVDRRKLGGIMAWSMGLDSHDYSHLTAIQAGYQKYLAGRAT